MKWMKLKGLQNEANRIGRPICAWTPSMLATNLPPNHPDREYVLDKKGKPSQGNYLKEGMNITPHYITMVCLPHFVETKPLPSPRVIELPRWDDRRKTPELLKFRIMTLEEAKALSYDDHIWFEGTDHKARQCKINGMPKVWKRTPYKVQIPVKYGMYEYSYFTEQDLDRILVAIQ